MRVGELIFDWNVHHENEEDSIAVQHGDIPGASVDISMSQLEALIRFVNERFPGFSERIAGTEQELQKALQEAMDAIQIFHGPGWEIYRDHAPEMKRWRALLSGGK